METPCKFLDTSRGSIVECRALSATSCPRNVEAKKKRCIVQMCFRGGVRVK